MSSSNLQADLTALLKSKQLWDVTLVTSDKAKLTAHKALLAARCGTFSLQLISLSTPKKGSKDVSPVLEMQVDFTKAVGERILEFIYTDNVSLNDLSRDDLFKLTISAKKLELERLFVFCQRQLCGLNMENIVATMMAAVKNEWKTIETYCYDFILRNYKDVVVLPNFSTLGPQLLVRKQKQQNIFISHRFFFFRWK